MGEMSRAFRTALSRYATFTGRASRPEYWWWALAVFLILIGASLVDFFLIMPSIGADPAAEDAVQPLSTLVSLALLLPNIAVGARRLHDIGRSGWWLLLGLIPLIGFLVLLYFFVQRGDSGDNQFGPESNWALSP